MKKIILLNPPSPPGKVSNKDMMGGFGQLYSYSEDRIPVIDLAYAGAILKQNNVNFRIIDAVGEGISLQNVISALKDENPEFVAVRTSTPTFNWDVHVCQKIKSNIKCKIIIFGPHCSIFPKDCIELDCIDFVINCEPEFTIFDILNKKPSQVKGIYFKHNGQKVKTTDRPKIENLDSLPYPAWESMPYRNYSAGSLVKNKKPFVTMLSSRGCPFACDYCPYPISEGTKWRAMSPKRVVDEMEYLANKLGVRSVLFRDPIFTLDRRRVENICNELISRKINLLWRVETRIDCIDEKLIKKMNSAGCIGINFGIESADLNVLKKVGRKSFSQEKVKEVINACKNLKMDTFLFFIIGLPGDTKESIFKTIKLAKELDPEFCQFTVATPYPGTKLAKWAAEKGFMECNKSDSIGCDASMRNEALTAKKIKLLSDYASFSLIVRKREMKRRAKEGVKGVMKNIAALLLYCYFALRVLII